MCFSFPLSFLIFWGAFKVNYSNFFALPLIAWKLYSLLVIFLATPEISASKVNLSKSEFRLCLPFSQTKDFYNTIIAFSFLAKSCTIFSSIFTLYRFLKVLEPLLLLLFYQSTFSFIHISHEQFSLLFIFLESHTIQLHKVHSLEFLLVRGY